MPRALILDFDGTMVDTEWPSYQAWLAIYERYGAVLSLADWAQCVGSGTGFDPVAHLTAQVHVPLSREALIEQRMADKVRRIGEAPLLPGVWERIKEARQLQWAVGVASSSPASWVHSHLKRLRVWSHVDAVCTRDDVHAPKPDPAVFLKAAQALGVAPQNCVVCEDSQNGMRAALNAGMQVVVIPNAVTAHQNFDGAHRIVSSLQALSLSSCFPDGVTQ